MATATAATAARRTAAEEGRRAGAEEAVALEASRRLVEEEARSAKAGAIKLATSMDPSALLQEVALLRKCCHPNVLPLLGF